MRILVVDDAEESREIIEAALLSGGYNDVATAASAAEAYQVSWTSAGDGNGAPPAADIVLLDIMMPEIDGIEACARIRNDPRYADVPDHHGDVARRHGQPGQRLRGRRQRLHHQAAQPHRADRARARRAQAQGRARPAPGARARAAAIPVELGRSPRLASGSTRPPACSSARSRRPISLPLPSPFPTATCRSLRSRSTASKLIGRRKVTRWWRASLHGSPAQCGRRRPRSASSQRPIATE